MSLENIKTALTTEINPKIDNSEKQKLAAVLIIIYDDPPKIMDFIKENIDYDRLFEGALQKKINMFYDAMSWDLPVDKKNTLERFF